MASYELRFKKSVAEDLRSIPKKEVAKLRNQAVGN